MSGVFLMLVPAAKTSSSEGSVMKAFCNGDKDLGMFKAAGAVEHRVVAGGCFIRNTGHAFMGGRLFWRLEDSLNIKKNIIHFFIQNILKIFKFQEINTQ